MSDPPNVATPDPPEATIAQAPAAPNDAPALPVVRFPPIPPIPDGVKIIPFKDFKECGIQIFSEGDEEIDGLGIPTVPLRVLHNTDKSKTNAKPTDGNNASKREEKKGKKGKGKGKGKREPGEEPLDPIAKAQEQRRQRLLLFAKQEWYEQWAEGEDLRGTRIYDQNLSPIDRIHMAATEFRVGRVWPPGYMRVNYLWDQFRLYAGLLGSPPIWTRTDLPQQENSEDDDDDETDSDIELAKIKKSRERAAKQPKESEDENDSIMYSDEDEDEIQSPRRQKQRAKADAVDEVDQEIENARPGRQKRIPPRTPYALYNLVPIPVSSDAEVRKLLALAAARRESRLLKFLADPEHSTRVFLSWYLRHEGLVWSPTHLVSFPHLLSFFLSFLVRVRALPESERSLKKAAEVARRAVAELGRTGKICRELPDRFGAGANAIWGKRWEEEPWSFGWDEDVSAGRSLDSDHEIESPEVDKEAQEEALRRFEEELRVANVQILPADPVDLGFPPAELDTVEVEVESDQSSHEVGLLNNSGATDVVTEAHTVTLSGPKQVGEGATNEGETLLPPAEPYRKIVQPLSHDLLGNSGIDAGSSVVQEIGGSAASVGNILPPPLQANQANEAEKSNETPVPYQPLVVANEDDLSHGLDWSKPDGKANATEIKAAKDAWKPSMVQPLMELFGMTTLPLKYDAGGRGGPNKIGVVERSMRRVKAVSKPGEGDRERKWKGLEDDLTKRLSRVVLTPWIGWDDGGIAIEYRTPSVQGDTLRQTDENGAEQELPRHAARYAHDPEKDDITLLVEPHVADLIVVGMGLGGTWVQLVPARDESPRPHSDRGRGRGRGRGQGHTAGGGGRPQKEFTFWYAEHVQLAVPSFWTVGEEEEPITLEDLEEALELDLEL